MLDVKVQRPCEDYRFHVPSGRDELIGAERVFGPGNVLLDDRTFVEIRRNVVRRSADELHASLVGLVIGLCTLEARQKGMVDVDRATVELAAEIVREHLHVAGEHDEIDALALEMLMSFADECR